MNKLSKQLLSLLLAASLCTGSLAYAATDAPHEEQGASVEDVLAEKSPADSVVLSVPASGTDDEVKAEPEDKNDADENSAPAEINNNNTEETDGSKEHTGAEESDNAVKADSEEANEGAPEEKSSKVNPLPERIPATSSDTSVKLVPTTGADETEEKRWSYASTATFYSGLHKQTAGDAAVLQDGQEVNAEKIEIPFDNSKHSSYGDAIKAFAEEYNPSNPKYQNHLEKCLPYYTLTFYKKLEEILTKGGLEAAAKKGDIYLEAGSEIPDMPEITEPDDDENNNAKSNPESGQKAAVLNDASDNAQYLTIRCIDLYDPIFTAAIETDNSEGHKAVFNKLRDCFYAALSAYDNDHPGETVAFSGSARTGVEDVLTENPGSDANNPNYSLNSQWFTVSIELINHVTGVPSGTPTLKAIADYKASVDSLRENYQEKSNEERNLESAMNDAIEAAKEYENAFDKADKEAGRLYQIAADIYTDITENGADRVDEYNLAYANYEAAQDIADAAEAAAKPFKNAKNAAIDAYNDAVVAANNVHSAYQQAMLTYDNARQTRRSKTTPLMVNGILSRWKKLNDALDLVVKDLQDKAKDKKMSAVEQYRMIHDFICGRASYNYDSLDLEVWLETSERFQNAHSAYGMLVKVDPNSNKDDKGWVVCQGYADTFLLLCQKMDLPCVYVSGEAYSSPEKSEAHGWVHVPINGKWYAIDATWDDGSTMNRYVTTNNPDVSLNYQFTFEQKYTYFGKNSFFGEELKADKDNNLLTDHVFGNQNNFPENDTTVFSFRLIPPALDNKAAALNQNLHVEEFTVDLPSENTEYVEFYHLSRLLHILAEDDMYRVDTVRINVPETMKFDANQYNFGDKNNPIIENGYCTVESGMTYYFIGSKDGTGKNKEKASLQWHTAINKEMADPIIIVEKGGTLILENLDVKLHKDSVTPAQLLGDENPGQASDTRVRIQSSGNARLDNISVVEGMVEVESGSLTISGAVNGRVDMSEQAELLLGQDLAKTSSIKLVNMSKNNAPLKIRQSDSTAPALDKDLLNIFTVFSADGKQQEIHLDDNGGISIGESGELVFGLLDDRKSLSDLSGNISLTGVDHAQGDKPYSELLTAFVAFYDEAGRMLDVRKVIFNNNIGTFETNVLGEAHSAKVMLIDKLYAPVKPAITVINKQTNP